MKAQLKIRKGVQCVTYELSAEIESRVFVVQHRITDIAYRDLDDKDVRKLIERNLWVDLMRNIEHELKRGIDAHT